MGHFLAAHEQVFFGMGALWVFSAFVGGMPAPDTSSGKAYRWAYGSLHLLAANLEKVGQAVKPPLA